MGKSNIYNEPEEEMTVELDLDDGTTMVCEVLTIFEVEGKDYIALVPVGDDSEEDEVWFYRYSENPDDPNEEPTLDYIDDDAEYDAVIDAFDEYLDEQEFDEMND